MITVIIGIALGISAVSLWRIRGYSELIPEETMRLTIPSATLIVIGIQSIFVGFIMSILKVRARK